MQLLRVMAVDEIYGYIENIVFCESENGFTVARLKEPKKAEFTAIVGVMPSVQPGESIRCRGRWKTHPQHGIQFEVQEFELQAPRDLVGIQKYLESGMIRGIGPVYAERIVKQFGLDTLQVIENSPERLLEVEGIGGKRFEKIQSCWQEQQSSRAVIIFLQSYGVSPSYAKKIFKAYGEASIEKVKTDPFALAKDIFGIGFKIADTIAKSLGVPETSAQRLDAGIEHVFWELSNQGHTCYPKEEFAVCAQEMLQVDLELIRERIEALVKQGKLLEEEERLWLRPLYVWEVGIAREIARILYAPGVLRAVNGPKALEWVQALLKIELAKEQVAAVIQGVSEKIQVITGGPGTGKSTITRAILKITEKLSGKILLAAPTGRAAKRMTEITRKKAFTIHSLLERDFKEGGFKRNQDNPLQCDLLIVDEASMIDTQLMYSLLRAVPSSARVIFIGDVDQLPSVGPGNVLRDLIHSERLPVTVLKQIFRQAAGSRIVTNAHRINQGIFPDLSERARSDFIFLEVEEAEDIVAGIVDLVKTRLPKTHRFHRFEEIQVLCPMRKGLIGSENLNRVLQQALNPSPNPLCKMGRAFHQGDKVMQIRNNYQKEVYNGDVGKIVSIDENEQSLQVAFEGRVVPYDFLELDELVLAYAVSIHKYQGSECPCVIIPVHLSHFKLLHRNLLYTGITRGKKLVVLIGMKKAIAIGVQNEEVKKRYTGLEEIVKKILPARVGT